MDQLRYHVPMTRPQATGRAMFGLTLISCVSLFGLPGALRARAAEDVAAEAHVDFVQDVQPIFAKHCVACHGPDNAEGGLQLTERDSVFGELDSGLQAIVPHKLDESELWRRVSSDDEFERMPPEGKPLSEDEQDVIRRWIAQGAAWQDHWAFVPPVPREPPSVERGAWVNNEIDAFILHRLEQKQLQPVARAEPQQLLRRVYYDLTGLPPTPDQVQQYLQDPRPDRYERLVDRLLKSPRFGERWGRHWLDLVRFAETNSFERDGAKPEAWRYRDYVIRSFNEDKPYDQFIIEQLAGDELEQPTADSIIATGYYRLGLWDDEPADPKLARYDGLDDIVSTTGQVFLGLTINCARCHDHKIDPIPQTDYYGMLAFFHNITPMGNGGDRILRPIFSDPAARQQYEQQKAELQQQRDEVERQLQQTRQRFAQKLQQVEGQSARVSDLEDLQFAFFRDTWDNLPPFDQLKPEDEGVLEQNLFDLAPATRNEAFGFVFSGYLRVAEPGRYTFFLDADDGARLVVDQQVVLEYDGIHGLGDEQQATVSLRAGRLPIRLEYFQRHGDKGLQVAWSTPQGERRWLSAAAPNRPAVELSPQELEAQLKQRGRELLGQSDWEHYQALRKQREQLRRQQVPVEQALCVTEFGAQAPETHVLLRGSPHSPGEPVEPHFPELFNAPPPELPEMPADAPSSGRRLVLARWIASPENMQTSRVMVNRVWQHLFGRGIVESSNNFGILGTPPTHPELLDWLALRFVQDGWRVKSLIRLIMLSNTYQMSTQGNESCLAVDPANSLFWRQNMRRLSAEEVRDSILAVTGQLNLQMHGPSVFPEIPAEVMAGQSKPGDGWGKSPPHQQARRSVYVYVKRSLLVPILQSFDSADTDFSCPVRFTTTQPTQALGMLNGTFLNRQAQLFAERLQREAGPQLADQVRQALWLTCQRPPAEEEVARGVQLITQLQHEDGADRDLAFRAFCLMALNLNEFIYLD